MKDFRLATAQHSYSILRFVSKEFTLCKKMAMKDTELHSSSTDSDLQRLRDHRDSDELSKLRLGKIKLSYVEVPGSNANTNVPVCRSSSSITNGLILCVVIGIVCGILIWAATAAGMLLAADICKCYIHCQSYHSYFRLATAQHSYSILRFVSKEFTLCKKMAMKDAELHSSSTGSDLPRLRDHGDSVELSKLRLWKIKVAYVEVPGSNPNTNDPVCRPRNRSKKCGQNPSSSFVRTHTKLKFGESLDGFYLYVGNNYTRLSTSSIYTGALVCCKCALIHYDWADALRHHRNSVRNSHLGGHGGGNALGCRYLQVLHSLSELSFLLLRWPEYVAGMGQSRNAYRVWVGSMEGKRPLRRTRRRWQNNIQTDLREVGYDDRDWINLAQNSD
ncbi:hypothetical protein ANN_06900 [Periplaneta americana]|uniref:Uncharacterized protein n=1 Tax=Periplaneta americana TaxID=6978 RepID=A0ABQ8TG59_PERAM|nr:hypothetical protein ANN_06900 [Periplaneta americana]